MALRKPSLESARVSAGELTLGEFGSVVWDREERPRVNMLKLGRGGAAIVTDSGVGGLATREGQDTFEGREQRTTSHGLGARLGRLLILGNNGSLGLVWPRSMTVS